MQYTNNSVVNITDIGNDSAALICTTTNPTCCLSTDGSEWYFPDGSQVQRNGTTYYRTKTYSDFGVGTLRLNRNPGATTTGVFHCDIPDGSGDLQSLYVGIYNASTGESCTTSQEPARMCLIRVRIMCTILTESSLISGNLKHLTLKTQVKVPYEHNIHLMPMPCTCYYGQQRYTTSLPSKSLPITVLSLLFSLLLSSFLSSFLSSSFSSFPFPS